MLILGRGARLRAISAATVVVVLSACGGGPVRESFETNTTRLFTTAYDNIGERYIDSVPLDSVALAGLAGISSIDPNLAVSRSGSTIQVSQRNVVMASYAAPDARDPRGWAVVTTEVVKAGRAVSEPLRGASDDAVYQAMFDGATKRLDPFTRYLAPDSAREERARRVGFGGIGLRLHTVNARTEILSVMPETPAATAGLKAKDRIVRIDGAVTDTWELKDVIEKLRGPVGGRVSLTVERPEQAGALTFDLVREKIVPQTVTAEMYGGVLHMKISNFNQDTAKTVQQQVAETRRRFGAGLAGIVLDLRDNPGGLLDQAVRVADLFLRKGVISTTRGRHADSVQHFDASGEDISAGTPVAVLVNGASASAAEVLAAALQDNGRAVVIGTATYGKGTVQTVLPLPNEGELVLTWSRLHAPSGYDLHRLGVMPVVCTSGGKESAKRVLDTMRKKGTEVQALLHRWQGVLRAEGEVVDRLRAECQPDKANREVDMEVAKGVLQDVTAYRQAVKASQAELAKQ
jgi:carboxyl-terminal processing protease